MMNILLILRPSSLPDSVLPILIALSTISIGLVAFVYPKIFETTRSLKDISQIFVEKLQRKFYLRYYLGFITACLLINLASIGIYVTNNSYINILLLLNFTIVFCGILCSYFVFKLLTKYYNHVERLFNPEKINLVPRQKNENLELLQILALHSIKNQYDLDLFDKSLRFIEQIFRKNILKNIKTLKENDFLGLSREQDYLYRPLEIITYIFQTAVNENKQEISNNVLNVYLEILRDTLLEWDHTPAFKLELKLINVFIQNIKYKINRGKIYNDDIIFISNFYFLLCEYYKNKLPNIEESINTSLVKPNEIIFPIFQSLINNNVSNDLLQLWQDLIKNFIHSDRIDRIKVLQLNSQIISYLIFRNKYKEAYEYMYYETPKENHSDYTFPQMPRYLTEIFRCYIGKDSAFLQNQTFDKNQHSEKFKYYTLFLFLCNAKDRADNLKKQTRINDWEKEFIEKDIERYTNITDEFIESLSNNELFFNFFINDERILKTLDDFFKVTQLTEIFQIDESYKNFIETKIKILREKIIKKQKNILHNPISDRLISDIKTYSQDIFESLTPSWFIERIFETKKQRNNKFISLFTCLKRKKIVSTISMKNITITEEKGRFLTQSNLDQHLFLNLSQQMYRHFFERLQTCLKSIRCIEELPSMNLNNYCLISNFSATKKILENLFSQESLCLDKVSQNVRSIKIGNANVPFILRDYLFHENFCKKPTILLIDRSKIQLNRISYTESKVEEKALTKGRIFDDLFNPAYSTDKEISVTIPSPIEIKCLEKNIGYKIKIKN